MKVCKDYKTKLYRDDHFYIEVRIYDNVIEAWLQHDDYSISTLMFGGVYDQNNRFNFNYREFIKFIEENLDEYENVYIRDIILKEGRI